MIDVEQLVGEVLQQTYRVDRLLGKGGMGAVFEAAHLRLDRRFALKVLYPKSAARADALARFRREAQLTGALGNPHIVEVMDVNETDEGLHYIVMELLEGEDLGQRLKRVGKLEMPAVSAILEQICSALQAVHSQGIIHRDIKPNNIFLCAFEGKQDHVKLLDFGISKVLGSSSVLTQTDAVLGSPGFMAPEQAEGHTAAVDARTDIYAVGTILYQMLSSRVPFEASSVPALLYKIVHKQATPLTTLVPGLPAAVEAVVARAMAKRPGDRYQDIAAFRDAFVAAVDSPADSGALLPGTAPGRRWLPVLLAAGAGLALAALGASVALAPAGEGPPRQSAAAVPDAAPVAAAARTAAPTVDAGPRPASAPAAPARAHEPDAATKAAAARPGRRVSRRPGSGRRPQLGGTKVALPEPRKEPAAPAKPAPSKKPRAPFEGDL